MLKSFFNKDTPTQLFSYEYCEIFKNIYFEEHLQMAASTVSDMTEALLVFNLLSANITKWSNTLKQFVGKLPTNCLSVFDHFVGLAVKGLTG